MAAYIAPGASTISTNPAAEGDIELQCCSDESSYYDVMMIGKTGTGKSTVGNKLLEIDPETKGYVGSCRLGIDNSAVIKEWDIETDQKAYFETGDGMESVTKKCKLLSNEKTKNRVLDTRGFADSENTLRLGVIQGNLQNFRWILQAQRAYNLCFARILYFFPNRGPPERYDGHLQEEISVMYSFFGQQIFDLMVIIVTNYKRDCFQQAGFSKDDIAKTETVFKEAFKKITGAELPKCPPVVYIPLNEDYKTISDKIVGAPVISEAETLQFSPEYPKDHSFSEDKDIPVISISIDLTSKEKRQIFRQNRGKHFQFEDRCTRCAIKIVQEKLPSGDQLPVRVLLRDRDKEHYDNSYCHPFFIPKHSRFIKFLGGIAHIVVLGMGKAYEKMSKKKSWPGFGSCDEKCVLCGHPPGADGCKPVNQLCTVEGFTIMVKHSKELDLLQLEAENEDIE